MQLTIGHGINCDIRIDDEYVSTIHARLTLADSGDWYIEDMGSTNGSYANRARFVMPQPLKPDDIIRLGRTTCTGMQLIEMADAAAVAKLIAQAQS